MEAWRIGFIGTLVTGLNREWISRIKVNPAKFAIGVIQIAAAVALTAMVISMVAANSAVMVPVTAGSLLS